MQVILPPSLILIEAVKHLAPLGFQEILLCSSTYIGIHVRPMWVYK